MGLFRRKRLEPRPAPARPTPDDRRTELNRLTGEFQTQLEHALPSLMADIDRETAQMLADLTAKHPSPPPRQAEPNPSQTSFAASSAPSWMSAVEWADRLTVYRRQGRSEADIRRVAEHLERRGAPPTLAERVVQAKERGVVFREEYMTTEEEARALTRGADGLLDARLRRVRNRLLIVTPLGWVNPRSRAAYKAGLFSFLVRGTAYHEDAARRGDFTPGTPVRLVREPDNPHDSNAIAVYAAGARKPAGYVPRGHAKRLANILDAHADMVAVSVRGPGAGSDDVTPHVLVCERALYDHLTR